MEFQAYPSVLKGKMSAMCRIQNMLHSSDTAILPCALLLCASMFVLYEHVTAEAEKGALACRNFLALIVVTMLPLAYLEKKIFACSDPVGAFSKFSTKVLLMHTCFIMCRILHGILASRSEYQLGATHGNFYLCTLLAACIMLPVIFGFRFSRKFMNEHMDVWLILLLAFSAAAITEVLIPFLTRNSKFRARGRLMGSLESAMLYIELTAFVPAIWTVCRSSKDTETIKFNFVEDTQKRAVWFFAFTFVYYLFEDIIFGALSLWGLPLAQLGHLAHFLLLLDFAGFILAHLFDSEKLEKLVRPLVNLIAEF